MENALCIHMTLRRLPFSLALSLSGLLLIACSSSSDGADIPDADTSPDAGPDASPKCTAEQQKALTDAIGPKLDTAASDTAISDTPDFTLLLETYSGQTYVHSQGASTGTTSYESASTSKLVTAVVIMDAVDRGALTLETKAHDLLPFWADTNVTLRQLLAFVSGANEEPLCQNVPNADFEDCVTKIYEQNAANFVNAGATFYYASTHLQVAGLMALKASKVGSWSELFGAFKGRTSLFATSVYDLPSATNPRLAGGMHWNANEYLGFLRALAKGQLLSEASRKALFANQRGSASVTASPALKGVTEDWAYGLGNWLECTTATTAGSYNCGEGHRNSSPGAYGAYPFIDFDHQYFGILARQGALGTGYQGVNIVRAANEPITNWAECAR